MRTFRIANVSQIAGFRWILDRLPAEYAVEIEAFDAHGRMPLASFRRCASTWALRRAHEKKPFDLVISHGPIMSAWTAALLAGVARKPRHLAFAFNFTEMPTGWRFEALRRAYASVDAFACFTISECDHYAEYFGVPRAKMQAVRWGVAPPKVEMSPPPPTQYFAVLGGEARDYATLLEAAERAPDVRFIVVARPHNFSGLAPPPNVDVRFNLPLGEAWSIVANAVAAILPLRSRDTACGLVTLVGTMHLGLAQITTDSAAVREYARDGETALFIPPHDPSAIVASIRRLMADEDLRMRLGRQARATASAEYSEAATFAYFESVLARWFSRLTGNEAAHYGAQNAY